MKLSCDLGSARFRTRTELMEKKGIFFKGSYKSKSLSSLSKRFHQQTHPLWELKRNDWRAPWPTQNTEVPATTSLHTMGMHWRYGIIQHIIQMYFTTTFRRHPPSLSHQTAKCSGRNTTDSLLLGDGKIFIKRKQKATMALRSQTGSEGPIPNSSINPLKHNVWQK